MFTVLFCRFSRSSTGTNMKRRLVVHVVVVSFLKAYVNYRSIQLDVHEWGLSLANCKMWQYICLLFQVTTVSGYFKKDTQYYYLTNDVWRYSCRGLYVAHKFLFTLLLAFKIDLQTKKVRFFPLYLRSKVFDLVGILCSSPYVYNCTFRSWN